MLLYIDSFKSNFIVSFLENARWLISIKIKSLLFMQIEKIRVGKRLV